LFLPRVAHVLHTRVFFVRQNLTLCQLRAGAEFEKANDAAG
jgi:hypothetical protein